MNLRITVLASAALLAACTAPVDRDLQLDGTRNANFDPDYNDCHAMAARYSDGSEKDGTIGGAVIGGLAGGLEASEGDRLEGAIVGAALGGLIGRAEAEGELDKEKRNVLIRCMQNRGHAVIG